jgi:hypothetical protein
VLELKRLAVVVGAEPVALVPAMDLGGRGPARLILEVTEGTLDDATLEVAPEADGPWVALPPTESSPFENLESVAVATYSAPLPFVRVMGESASGGTVNVWLTLVPYA